LKGHSSSNPRKAHRLVQNLLIGKRYRYSGKVQGVGFRPAVFRVARGLRLQGRVFNDVSGAVVELWAQATAHEAFVQTLASTLPPAARVDAITTEPLSGKRPEGFVIEASRQEGRLSNVVPDLATCPECLAEVREPRERRFRYPLTNCTQCGPRYSILREAPYDRARTSMSGFALCAECLAEYENPEDRRFHAQPVACPACGPQVRLERLAGHSLDPEPPSGLDDVEATAVLLKQGEIVAIKGIGGFHLACDATQPEVVRRLRERKHRQEKPFALLAKSVEMIHRFCEISPEEQDWLESPAAPIVLLKQHKDCPLPAAVAPGQATLGFMLPYTPLHHLLLAQLTVPLVMTSGNRSDEPQCLREQEVRERLSGIADWMLWHDREIVNRSDDSLLRKTGVGRQILRRARGFAPEPLPLPQGFEQAPGVLACGAELKNTFCLLQDGAALLSPHIGDLRDGRAEDDFRNSLERFEQFYQTRPEVIAVDLHPDYRSTRYGEARAATAQLPLVQVQHHHAHIASCLGEHQVPLDSPPVLGVALDGTGMGTDETVWGGEFLLADYRGFQRLGAFKPIPLLGGNQAMREPWRNLLAQVLSGMGWVRFQRDFPGLDLIGFLEGKPLQAFTALMEPGRSPLASSCGRLFDAVAAAVGVCRESMNFEGQAAMQLEALAQEDEADHEAYPFDLTKSADSDLLLLESRPLWEKLFADLAASTPCEVMAGRFHRGLAQAIVRMVLRLSRPEGKTPLTDTIVLSGGVFQNTLLLDQVWTRLQAEGYRVLTHAETPANDGGIALGQALIAAAKHLYSG